MCKIYCEVPKRALFILIVAMMCSTLCVASDIADVMRKIWGDLNNQNAVLLQLQKNDDGGWEVYSATKSQVARSPEWLVKSDPPLSLLDAVDHARTHLQKEHKKHKSFLPTAINMHLIASDESPNRWYYTVDFQVKFPVEGGWGTESFQVFLLMDGTIIKPKAYGEQQGRSDSHQINKEGSLE